MEVPLRPYKSPVLGCGVLLWLFIKCILIPNQLLFFIYNGPKRSSYLIWRVGHGRHPLKTPAKPHSDKYLLSEGKRKPQHSTAGIQTHLSVSGTQRIHMTPWRTVLLNKRESALSWEWEDELINFLLSQPCVLLGIIRKILGDCLRDEGH